MITHLTHPRRLRRTTSRPAARSPAGASGGGENFGSGEFFFERGGADAPPPPPQNARKPNKTGGWTFLGVGETAKFFFRFFLFGLANGQEVW